MYEDYLGVDVTGQYQQLDGAIQVAAMPDDPPAFRLAPDDDLVGWRREPVGQVWVHDARQHIGVVAGVFGVVNDIAGVDPGPDLGRPHLPQYKLGHGQRHRQPAQDTPGSVVRDTAGRANHGKVVGDGPRHRQSRLPRPTGGQDDLDPRL